METLHVSLKRTEDLSYDIRIGDGTLALLPEAAKAAGRFSLVSVITDRTVNRLYGAKTEKLLKTLGVPVIRQAVPAGEKSKTRRMKEKLEDGLLARRAGRDTLVVALGGGVIGDLAGFVAATLNRGVPFIQVPTTLLAMVDSSVGGKLAVDTPHGKNLVGVFKQPVTVLADTALLKSLPPREVLAGLAEAFKHGVIADPGLFELLTGNAKEYLRPGPGLYAPLVRRACEVKARVVEQDEKESNLRQVLNFGHTAAHAIETLRGYRTLHGEAVWAGMAVEAELAENLGLLDSASRDRIVAGVHNFFPGWRSLLKGLKPADIVKAARSDKKNRAGEIRYALPAAIGRMYRTSNGGYSVAAPPEALVQAVKKFF